MLNHFDALDLKKGERIAVSFSCSDVAEVIGMINALFERKVIVRAIVDMPLQQYEDGKITEFKIKTIDAYTTDFSSDDEEKPTKRRK